jgi:hypothetical protein
VCSFVDEAVRTSGVLLGGRVNPIFVLSASQKSHLLCGRAGILRGVSPTRPFSSRVGYQSEQLQRKVSCGTNLCTNAVYGAGHRRYTLEVSDHTLPVRTKGRYQKLVVS